MSAAAEPLSGLIEFMVWDEAGNGITRFRYYSMQQHTYGNGQFAGRFVDGTYTCALHDGTKVIAADGADGVRVTIFAEDGAPSLSFRTSHPTEPRCEIEAASGKFFGWHANGKLAVAATFSQAMYDAWGIDVHVSPRAALSPRTHATFRACVEPWLQSCSQLPESLLEKHKELSRTHWELLRTHGQRGLEALRASDEIDVTTILALMVLQLPTLDYDASLVCQLLMSTDPSVRARAESLLDKLGPGTERAVVRLALMKTEDENATVQDWVDAGLLRLGEAGLAELKRVSAAGEPWQEMLQPATEWLTANLGPG